MVTFHNPALKEESRNEPAKIIPLKESEPLLGWLQRTERLFKSDNADRANSNDLLEELEDETATNLTRDSEQDESFEQ